MVHLNLAGLDTSPNSLAFCSWAAGLVGPPLVCGAMSFLLLFTIHSLAGTPEVLATLAVPTTVATLYACAYTYRLWSRG